MKEREALELSRKIGEEVKKEVAKISGKREAGEVVGIGKDGTPTKRIDLIAERKALEILREADLRVVTEESGVVGEGEVTVALDPIDGTFNATRGIPIFSISLCFLKGERIRDAFFGYVMNLATGDEYYSLNNKSYKNGEKIEVSKKEDVECDVVIYYPKKKYPFRRVRIYGCSSLEICYVAEGAIDAFIDIRVSERRDYKVVGYLRSFDVAAALFIAKNARAKISDPEGKSVEEKVVSMEERFRLVVANEKLHEKILRVL